MKVRIVGDPDGGPPIDLDHTRFSYAGKFVMSSYGKALATEGETVVGAVAFNRDRTDGSTVWFRFLTVRSDRQGEGIGARLAADTAERLLDTGIDEIRIAVNNPFAYEACYKAGFGYVGTETGLVELVLAIPDDRSTDRYREGLRAFLDRDTQTEAAHAFVEERIDAEPPAVLPVGEP